MATREIIRMGNPILATMAQPIQPDDVATLPDVIQDMIDKMRAAKERFRGTLRSHMMPLMLKGIG